MDKKTISVMKKMFDGMMHQTEEGVECWYARELMGVWDMIDGKIFIKLCEKQWNRVRHLK